MDAELGFKADQGVGVGVVRADEERKVPLCLREMGVRSLRVRDIRGLELPRSTNPSRTRMQQPRKPNTSDGALSSESPLLFANRISDDSSPVEHIPLPRCSTGPEPESFPDLLAANGWHDPATRRTVTNKLMRMGFSAKDGQPTSSVSLLVHEQKSRFSIKLFFQAK